MHKLKIVFLISREMQSRCFSEEDLGRIRAIAATVEASCDECTDEFQMKAIRGADIAITGWGTLPMTSEILDAAPGLKLVCHSAGSVRHLIDVKAFLERQIRVCSARGALATGVAEFAFGMMLVSMKGVWALHTATGAGRWDRDAAMDWIREPFGATVGIVGASHVGREMIRLCRTLELAEILLYDPYVSAAEARAMGCEKAELDDLMLRSDVVSLHTPAIEECRHLVGARQLALMKDHAILINTARGMCLDEQALVAELEKGRLLACLDVTDPEPPPPDSPLYKLPNCILTPHVAGSVKENTLRQGREVADQIEAFMSGKEIPGEIDLARYDRLA